MTSSDRIPAWAEIAPRYDVVETSLTIADERFVIAHVRDINALVDGMDPDDFGPDERLPYWAVLWDASRGLARHVLEAKGALGDTFELGAGLGLGAIAAAKRGARVIATDYEVDALAFARRNAELNSVSFETELLDWRRVRRAPQWRARFETVLAADVLYEERHIEPVADAIHYLSAVGGRVFVSDPRRRFFPSFRDALTARGFAVALVERDESVVLEGRRAFTPTPA